MSSEGATKLQYALKTLRTRWEDAKAGWDDQVRQDYEGNHLAPLEEQVGRTLHAMHGLAEILARARRDCSETRD